MSEDTKPPEAPVLKAPAAAGGELKRIRDMPDRKHGIPETLQHKSAIAKAIEQSQRIADLATPGGAIARILDEQRERFAAIERIGAALQGSRIGALALPESPFGRMLQQQQDQFAAFRRIGDTLNRQFAQLQGVADSLRPATFVLGDAFGAQQRRIHAMHRLMDDVQSPFESVRKRLLANHPQIGDALKRWSANAMAETVAEYVAHHTESDALTQSDIDDQLVELSVVFEELGKAQAEGRAGFSWEQWLAILGFVLQILMFVYQVRDSEAMEKRLTGTIIDRSERIEAQTTSTDAKLDRLVASLEGLRPHKLLADQYVVVVETLRLRAAPEGRELVRLHANQVVTATGQRGQWLRVRYFDYRDARLVEGWCWKKHLERVEKIDRPSLASEQS